MGLEAICPGGPSVQQGGASRPSPFCLELELVQASLRGPLLVRVRLTKPEREDAGFIVVLWKVLGTRVGRPSKGDGPAQRKVQGKQGVMAWPLSQPQCQEREGRSPEAEPRCGVFAP